MAHIVDTSGNHLFSTNNALDVNITNPSMMVNVAGLNFQNVGVIVADTDNVILNNGYTSFGASTFIYKLVAFRNTVATTGSDITTNTADTFNYGLLSGGVAVYAKSSSANDTNSAGTGARQIIIRGIDDMAMDGTSTLNMNGTSSTGNADTLFSRINSVTVMSAGSSLTNEGKITLYDFATNTEICNIPINYGVSALGLLTIPALKTAFLRRCTIQTTTAQTIYFYVNDNISNCWIMKHMCIVNGAYEIDLKLRLTSTSDFRIYSVATTTAGSCSVQIDYYIQY